MIPRWQLSKISKKRRGTLDLDKYLGLENEYRKTTAQIVGGLYVLGGFAFTWFQLVATQHSIVLSEERLVADRYSKAIDQLGQSTTQTRLGGIYALGSISKNSPEYVSIVDNVLASYVKQNCHQDSALKEELQASIDILTRKQFYDFQSGEVKDGINLSKVKLNGFDFNKSSLRNARLTEADMDRSDFVEADLSGLNANGTTFFRADLDRAIIEHAQLFGADFSQASLVGASVKNCNLKLAKLKEADLSKAIFTGCDMKDVDLENAKLYGTDLRDTKGLTKELLKNALIDENTKLPNI